MKCDSYGLLDEVCPHEKPYEQECFEDCLRETVLRDGRSQDFADKILMEAKLAKMFDEGLLGGENCDQCEEKEDCPVYARRDQ